MRQWRGANLTRRSELGHTSDPYSFADVGHTSDPYSFGHTSDPYSFGHTFDPYSFGSSNGHTFDTYSFGPSGSSNWTNAIGHTVTDVRGHGSLQSVERQSRRCVFGRKCEHCRHLCRWLPLHLGCTAATGMRYHGLRACLDST